MLWTRPKRRVLLRMVHVIVGAPAQGGDMAVVVAGQVGQALAVGLGAIDFGLH